MFTKHQILFPKVVSVFLSLLALANVIYFKASYTSQTIWIMLVIYMTQMILLRKEKYTLRSFIIVTSIICAVSVGLSLHWYLTRDILGVKSALGGLVTLGVLAVIEIVALKKKRTDVTEKTF